MILPSHSTDDPAGLASAADLAACYRLILAREPESEVVVASRVGAPLSGLVADFVGSEEFASRLVRPLLDGDGPPQGYAEPAEPEMRAWLGTRLGVVVEEGPVSRAGLLSALLRHLASEGAPLAAELLRRLARELGRPSARADAPPPEASAPSGAEQDFPSEPAHPASAAADDRTLVERSGLWDAGHYVDQAGPALGGADPLQHFLGVGGAAGLSPHPLFSSRRYVAENAEAVALGANPLVHYLRRGWREGRSPNAMFDPLWYGRRHGVGREPLGHYALHGRDLRLQAHPLFDAAWYRTTHPDVAASEIDPYTHFVEYGWEEGRRPNDPRRLGRALRVAVVAHVSDEELWPELSFHLYKLERPFDLFVTLPTAAGEALAQAIRAEWPGAKIFRPPAAGRDTGPFLSVLPYLMSYDAVCKLHMAPDTCDAATWRLLAFQGLLGSPDLVGRILGWFEADPALVMAGPDIFYLDGPWSTGVEEPPPAGPVRLTLGSEEAPPAAWGYFAGAIFWFRPSLFRDLPRQALIDELEGAGDLAAGVRAAVQAVERVLGIQAVRAGGFVGLTDVGGEAPPADVRVSPAALNTSRRSVQARLPERRARLARSQIELQKPERRRWVAPPGTAPGVNLIGPVEAMNGLGESARGYVRALRNGDVPVHVVPWRTGFERVRRLEVDAAPCGVQPINLVHLNLDLLEGLRLLDAPPLREWITPRAYNVAVVYWELAALDPAWRPILDRFDEVWVASGFMREAVAAGSDVTTRLVRPAIAPTGGAARSGGADLGVDPAAFTFFYGADASSGLARKNPQALWRAYADAFSPEEGACCIVKLSHADLDDPAVAEIRALAASRRDVRFIPDLLSPDEMAALFQRCDSYVSPHRSEGLGLTVVEAMHAGKPVVCTGYGGVTDFVTDETAYVVAHRLTEVGPDAAPYPSGFVWSDPDPASLRRQLRCVFDDREAARAVGRRGRDKVEALFGDVATARAIREEVGRIWSRGGGA